MRDIEKIHWHDSVIESVTEFPDSDLLIFNVQYPEDWERNIYKLKSIKFEGFCSYEISEIPFHGKPTIIAATVLPDEMNQTQFGREYKKVKIETNAGERLVVAKSVALMDPYE